MFSYFEIINYSNYNSKGWQYCAILQNLKVFNFNLCCSCQSICYITDIGSKKPPCHASIRSSWNFVEIYNFNSRRITKLYRLLKKCYDCVLQDDHLNLFWSHDCGKWDDWKELSCEKLLFIWSLKNLEHFLFSILFIRFDLVR